MKTQYGYIHFKEAPKPLLDETCWACHNNRTKNILGICVVNNLWHKWMFQPENYTEFSIGCLRDIADFMEQLEAPK
jgi:hypothetical protein